MLVAALLVVLGTSPPAWSEPSESGAVKAAYQDFDQSVDRYLQVQEELSDIEVSLENGTEEDREALEGRAIELRLELKRSEQKTLRAAKVYLGDKTKRTQAIVDIRDLGGEMLAQGERLLIRGGKNNLSVALWLAEKAIRFAPRDPKGHDLRARVLSALGNDRSAAAAAHDALVLNPNDLSPHKIIAVSQFRSGRYKQAADSVARAYTGKGLFGTGEGDTWKLPEKELAELEQSGRSNFHLIAGGIAAVFFCYLFATLIAWRNRRRKAQVEDRRQAAAAAKDAEQYLGGKYELNLITSYGKASQIWSAQDRLLKREVEVQKVMLDTLAFPDQVRAAFAKRARGIAALRHPHIMVIHEVLDLPGELYLVREVLGGNSVEEILGRLKTLSLEETVRILSSVCVALEAAHAAGLFHRTLCPAHIQVTRAGHVKVLDFGLSRILGEFEAGEYLPEEPADDGATTALDVYSLGACAFHMLTGMSPGGAQQFSSLPPDVADLLKTAMELDRTVRLQTVKEFSARLNGLKASPPAR